ncbi:MAG: N-acetylmuramic acid 6-phosphate etherase [Candidatus Acidiferrales bacterium]
MKRAKPIVTEQRHSRSRALDLKSTREILNILHRESARVPSAVGRELPVIARAVDAVVKSLSNGGRLFYVGAGTSGRLGALDAAELPPTFGISARKVRAIIAGGHRALTHAIEGAEDSAIAGARDLRRTGLKSNDVVAGITASGKTPYVLGALREARARRAVTIGITSNRHSEIARLARILIAPNTGAEVLAGSTRMNAGTAQKMVLNLLSTAAMVRLGYVYDNWMIGVALTNRKLRARGLRILEEATGASPRQAQHALRLARHDLRVALLMLKTDGSAAECRKKLQAAGGDLRRALGDR